MGIGPVSNSPWAYKHRGIEAEKNKPGLSETVNNTPAEQQTAPASSSEDQPGVIRLLQEGHFKGVADVRLRINFQEQLMGMETAAKTGLVEAEVATFENAVSEKINPFLQSYTEAASEGSEEGANAATTVTEALEAFANTRGALSEDLLEDLNTRFNTLITSIRDLIGPPVEDPNAGAQPPVEVSESAPLPADEAGEETPAVSDSDEGSLLELIDIAAEVAGEDGEIAGEPVSVWETLVQDLEESYINFLTELNGKTATYQILPPLSQPSGQGKAYDKFLAIYRALTGESQNTGVQAENLELLV